MFERVTFKHLNRLIKLLSSTTHNDYDFIKNKYNTQAVHFVENLEFLCEIGCINVKDRVVALSPTFKLFLDNTTNPTSEVIVDYLINTILSGDNIVSDCTRMYLLRFRIEGKEYIFSPTLQDNLSTSGLRNILIELGLVLPTLNLKQYQLTERAVAYLREARVKCVSPQAFQSRIQNQHKLGELAEKFCVEYEKSRLSAFPRLASLISHVSLTNVSAGYDIESITVIDTNPIKTARRFIEVKAVSCWDYTFFWSRNEMKIAEELKTNYFLYLLPYSKSKGFDLQNMLIVDDPYKNIGNSSAWSKTVENVSWSLVNTDWTSNYLKDII